MNDNKNVKCLGYIEKGTGKHQSNNVYSVSGLSPTVCASFESLFMDIDREIAAESRKQKAESRKQKILATIDLSVKNPCLKKNCELYNSKGRSWNKQDSINGKWCCYCNYRKVFRVDVKIATTLMARDYKGFGGSSEYSNGVIEIES